jgi:hypothetical protein
MEKIYEIFDALLAYIKVDETIKPIVDAIIAFVKDILAGEDISF